ncbi:Spore germination protein B1 [Sporomusa silvacetica DSM 10669]|uniref:Spore germination protein B1 n=1 Tax=Sporomusa silvacetica DSM 10669 TaxID=1123289 RepID=A0ABZ3ILN0_9FIRM|nr:spore germination protein B1 [Sporomusa silvacetica DSM 10669]
MKRRIYPCADNIKKLSAHMPKALIADTQENLDALKHLTVESNTIAEEINQIAQKLMTPNSSEKAEALPVSSSLFNNRQVLKHLFGDCIDVSFREFVIGKEQISAILIFIDGLGSKDIINGQIMKSLMKIQYAPAQTASPELLIKLINKVFLEAVEVSELTTVGEITDAVLTGDTILLVDGAAQALRIITKGWRGRDVGEPVTESVVRGPREGFTETIRTNTALLRRKIKSTELRLEKYIVGRITKTEINLAYLLGTADAKVVAEVRKRIKRIDVDSILESAYIEELIEDTPYTVFPQIEHSERPDKVAAAVLEGRVAILVDGTPFALIVPTIMVQFWQSSEDYYERYPVTWLVRLIRFAFSTIALLLPGVYVAIAMYHQEMFPTALLISIAGAHEGVPFPIYVEALLMELIFETLREAGVRLPQPVGQAVSIVGGLVIGEAAVRAGIISPATIIVVSLTGISSFALPSYNLSWSLRILRFVFGFLGFISGLYGIMLGMLILLIHIISLRSFGVPYFSPFAPFKLQDMKDVMIRLPWWAMNERPYSIPTNNRHRQKFYLKPRIPNANDK